MSELRVGGVVSILDSIRRNQECTDGRPPARPLGRAALLQTLKKKMKESEVGRKNCNVGRSLINCEVPVTEVPSSTFVEEERRRSDPDGESALNSSESAEAISSMESPNDLSRSETPLGLTMERGTKGKPISLCTNYIRLHLDQSKQLCQYRIEFSPPVDDKRLRYHLVGKLQDVIGKARSFDGTMLCLPVRLPNRVTTELVQSSRDPSLTYSVSIIFQLKKSFDSSDCSQHYNLLFQRVMNALKYERAQRQKSKFYDPCLASRIPSQKLEVWPGYVTAVNSFEGGVLLTCDVSHRVLQTTTVLDVFREEARNQEAGSRQLRMKKAVIGEVVLTRYNNRTYRIDDVDFSESPRSTFSCRGEEISYMEYYKRSYDVTIQQPDQPMLVHQKNMKGNQDSDPIRLMLVPEICYLTGLTERQRNDFRVMKDVSTHTQTSPRERQLKLRQLLQRIKKNEEAYSILTDWGITLPDEGVRLEGRVLDNQTILFGDGSQKQVSSDINRYVQELTMYSSVQLRSWLLVYDRSSEAAAKMLYDSLPRCAKKLGMEVLPPTMKRTDSDRADAYVKAVTSAFQPDHHQMVVPIVPSKRDDRYGAIKKLCSIKLSVLSQVITSKTLNRKDAQTIVGQIAMQINAKLGGEPWAAKATYKNAMIMGIDVSHDPKQSNSSVAVVVASLNKTFSNWFSGSKKQLPGVELLDGLQFLTIEALTKYCEENGCLPERIVVYRDGVGDGRLGYTERYEVPQLQEAFRNFNDYHPKLTFVVVSKRIMTRLLYANQRGGCENPPSGTVVDHTITSRVQYPDFYLVSQKNHQGTVSPTHYVVIYNQGEIPADQLQVLTYRLTYMYFNAKDPIRVPAPCQYADKLAGLIEKHLKASPSRKLSTKLHYI